MTEPLPAPVADLLARLDPDEKLAMLHQATPAVERLGLAAFHTGAEVLHGVAWLGTATVYPQPVGLAASWDADLVRRVGAQVGTELLAKHAADPTVSRNVWAPVVNPLRHPRWGRNEEGWSEDPHLTAHLAAAYAAGLRGDDPRVWRTVPTLKHFLGYNNETDRAVTSSQLPPRVLHEYELPAYRGPVEAGVVGAVMPSYNLVNGRPNHVAAELLAELRSWTDAELLVVSDAGAPTNLTAAERYYEDPAAAHAASLRAGVDSFTDNGTDPAPTLAHLRTALQRGLIDATDVDRAVTRLLLTRWRTGELTPGDDPSTAVGADRIDLPEHRALAREAAGRGVVVLGNDGILPLAPTGSLAVVGPLATRVLTDWYSGTPPYSVSLADAARERWDGPVEVVDGADRVRLRSTTTGACLHAGPGGVVLADAAAGTGQDWALTDWGEGVLTIASAATGMLWRARPDGAVVADAERPGGWVVQESFRAHRHGDGTWSYQHIGSGRWLRVEAYGGAVTASAAMLEGAERFVVRLTSSGTAEAARAARAADVVVCAVGNDPHLLGRETEDRPGIDLPAPAAELWRTVAEANDAAVLVLVSSYPYALDAAAEHARGLVWSSHGGQELGHGLVDVLTGAVEPSGRLTQTWWRSDADAGDLLDYDIVTAGTTYWYSDADPLFPFGHGLSYAPVAYEHLDAAVDGETVRATVRVRNAGARPATEVVQVYTAAPGHRLRFPRRLAAHARVHLAPGEARTVTLTLPRDRFAVWDAASRRLVVEPGTYEVAAGPNARDLDLRRELRLDGEPRGTRRLPLLAAEADAFHGARIEEATRERGSVVTAPGGRAHVDFAGVALPAGPLVARAARTGPGEAVVRLLVRTGGAWATRATAAVPDGGGRHELVDAPLVPVSTAGGAVGDVRVQLAGPVRLEGIGEAG